MLGALRGGTFTFPCWAQAAGYHRERRFHHAAAAAAADQAKAWHMKLDYELGSVIMDVFI